MSTIHKIVQCTQTEKPPEQIVCAQIHVKLDRQQNYHVYTI